MTLTAFLLARIAEDEARRVAYWHDVDCDRAASATANCTCGSQARVLAECEAKRRIVEEAMVWLEDASDWRTVESQDEEGAPVSQRILHLLAQPYADHPDFQPEWGA